MVLMVLQLNQVLIVCCTVPDSIRYDINPAWGAIHISMQGRPHSGSTLLESGPLMSCMNCVQKRQALHSKAGRLDYRES